MAAHSSWKGYLRLSLVACTIALYPATTDQEKVHFHRINKKTGHRVHVQNVDAETGEVVDKDELGRGYETSGGRIVPIEDEELEAMPSKANGRSRLISSCRPRRSTSSTISAPTTSLRRATSPVSPLLSFVWR